MADSLTHFITADRFLSKHSFSADFARGMFFGVQGPDPFFFGKDKNSFAFADSLHDCAPKAYFETDADKLDELPETERGYYFGVMLHCFEDRIMHQYVGYLCRKYPAPTTHGQVEREFDIVLYKNEYHKKIRTFNVKKYYAVEEKIVAAVYSFWRKRTDNVILTKSFVETSLRRYVTLTSVLLKANPLVVALVKLKERKEGLQGALSCHFKIGYTTEHMNLDHSEWDSALGNYTLSVPDIADKGLADFEKEFNLVNDCFKNKTPYVFNHTEWFSCGK